MLRWLPDSLFGRLFLATCVPILLMLATSYALVLRDRQTLAGQLGGSNATVDRIVDSFKRLIDLNATARAQTIQLINQELAATPPTIAPIRGRAEGRGSSEATVRAALNEFYIRPLRKELNADCRVSVARASASVAQYVNFAIPPGGERALRGAAAAAAAAAAAGAASTGGLAPPAPWILVEPAVRRAGEDGRESRESRALYDIAVSCPQRDALDFRVPAPPALPSFDARLSWQLVTMTGMLGALLFVMTRRLTQPLRELQRAADQVGRSQQVQIVRESGAREIRQSVRAFNTMQERLRRYLDSRTRVRTPLTRLRLRAESIEPPELRARLVGDIEEMVLLVDQSLDLFRGLNEQEPSVATDLNELLRAIGDECMELGQNFTLQGRASNSLAVRPVALKRALRNLIDNACKYGGAAVVSISDGSAVAVQIRDHGPGIPVSDLESVFEPFKRLESSRNRDSGGVGLGLSIARDVAELHGGTLQLANAPDGGLIATLTLPRR
jgi:signal transduction histidine kinase